MLKLEFTTEEVNTILNALGQRPFIEVHRLIDSIQRQAQQQLRTEADGVAPEVKASTTNPE